MARRWRALGISFRFARTSDRATPRIATSKGIAITCACRSAKRKLKNGNSVMLLCGGIIRLGSQKSNGGSVTPPAENRLPDAAQHADQTADKERAVTDVPIADLREALRRLVDAVQVADDRQQDDTQDAREQRPAAADTLEAGSPADALSRRLRQVVDDGEGGADGHGEEERHGQVDRLSPAGCPSA